MKKFKMPSAYSILLIITGIVAALTWIIPAGKYEEGVYQAIDKNPQGILRFLSAPVEGFYDAIGIALFVLVIGGFINVMIKTGAIDAAIGNLIKKFGGREIILIPIIMVILGIGGSTYGMAEETIAFYPLLIPVFVAAGFDVVTAVAVILIGAGTGVLCSTVNPFATGAASDAAQVSLGIGMGLRAMMFVVFEAIGIFYVLRYAKKVKKTPTLSVVSELKAENEAYFLRDKQETPKLTGKRKWILAIFTLTFVIMIIGVIPWSWKFGIDIFNNINDAIAKIPLFGVYATSSDNYWLSDLASAKATGVPLSAFAMGDWWFAQITVLFLAASVLVGKIFGFKEKEFVKIFIDGSKDLLAVALIIGVSRGIKIIMQAGGMDATILYWSENALKDMSPALFSIMTYIFYLPMSFVIPSTSGLAGATMPIIGPLAGSVFQNAGLVAEAGKAIAITAYQSASGLINLVSPTSGVVMGALALARLPYERWLKFIGKLLLIYAVVTVIFLVIASLIG
ncbi:MAG: YfcC family protein [Vallitaleaceae bacterium]|nr:YfcC family protein [Vallitaleaceae bacterium]